jgi:hypothetical protein
MHSKVLRIILLPVIMIITEKEDIKALVLVINLFNLFCIKLIKVNACKKSNIFKEFMKRSFFIKIKTQNKTSVDYSLKAIINPYH